MKTLEEKTENLAKASEEGDVAAVRALLESENVDVNGVIDVDGWTALHEASSKGHVPVVELLLKAGADLNAGDKSGWTALHEASSGDRLPVVELLLKAGAVPNAANKKAGETPLHYACEFANSDVVRALLDLGADLHAKDNNGHEPLHSCIRRDRYGHGLTAKTPETLQVLVALGATWDVKCDELVSSSNAREEAPALRICTLLWKQELADNLPFTNIPLEVIVRGVDSTQAYVEDLPQQKAKNLSRLLWASREGDVAAVRALLDSGNVDVNGADEDGGIALRWASLEGHLPVVELLLKAGADPNAAYRSGDSALRDASSGGYLPVVELLLKVGADPNAANKKTGDTPLHCACERADSEVARALLDLGADLHAKDKNGHEPLHLSLQSGYRLTAKTLETMQVLVSFGASWDAVCDELISSGKARKATPALQICMLLWMQEHVDRLPFTKIPVEVINRGVDSTQVYIHNLKNSVGVAFRRKICLVGSSCAGKTSLVKSIISKEPQLEHVDDRTIGIDHFPLRFSESNIGSDGKRKIHEVTFWDFAGQDAYQVAHSLFFSPRTLYLVCVDLQAFATAYMQAVILADDEIQEPKLLDEFVEDSVKRWVRMIVARQPEAEFVFLATKNDALTDNKVTEELLKNMLMTKLKHVEATVQQIRDELKKDKCLAVDKFSFGSDLPGGTDGAEPSVVYVSCASSDLVNAARLEIEKRIIQSEHSFEMPDTYTKALEAIKGIREAAQVKNTTTRIRSVFAPVDSLPAALKIEPALCRTILQTLHDLGDVLWYEDLGVELFENTVILDPMLLIDFIREVITHKHTGVTMSHADLISKRFWMGLSIAQMKAMKQLLQKVRLVYATGSTRVMEWNSDLTVPAFWHTKEPASWKFGWNDLRINKTWTLEGEAVRIKWEYIFEIELPPSLFDHVVVASVSPHSTFEAGPDWILYEEKEIAACRIMVCHDTKSLRQTIQIEAVVAEAATAKQTKTLWRNFESQCGAFVGELRDWPGLKGVSSFAYNDKQVRINMMDLLAAPYLDSEWMPPKETWKWFKQLVSEVRE